MNRMGPPRRFDWDEARRLRAEGWTLVALAERFSVSRAAIVFATNDAARKRAHERVTAKFRMICDDCGGPCSHNFWARTGRHDRIVCQKCAGVRRSEEALLSRMNEDGDLACSQCGEYKPMDAFSGNGRGYPRSECRSCETIRRQAWREANRERDRANDREAKRRARAAA